MRDSQMRSAAVAVAASLGLPVDDAVVLHASNKVTLRLLPCDAVARVSPPGESNARFEVDLARRLAEAGAPVAALDPRAAPRVYAHDGFEVTLWTHYESSGEVPPAPFAAALARLHAGMRRVDAAAPHFTERVEEAQLLLADRDRTPDLPEAKRELLSAVLRRMRASIAARGAPEQLLHGEPHPGNLLATAAGPRFIDFETCCRGPVEFDLAHAPAEVADHYPRLDRELLEECRLLMLAMVVTWRWDRDDRLPDGRRRGEAWLAEIRAALADRPESWAGVQDQS
ncbi:aminoglycoside phosphotransferase family protein [Glycomyces terrestris]|uniref:Aminoglycoside phosphotransferase family protein n=1 Tax=Glycomyces terrestris TaxID=2493553 RepID=A0A426V4P6_9ACTN|nr:aminoglycoside phosphotransferase family protein [Glycomyces terrestris]RRS01857.1 aminoglycoside phosphotransferase family protein [Glycomyces terrestris]